MAGHRVRMPRRVLCALAAAALLGLTVSGAYADPVYPSQQQVDQAQRAVRHAQSAVVPIEVRLNAAQLQLTLLVRRSQIAAEQYDAATVRLQEAELAAQVDSDQLAAAERHYADVRSMLGRLAAAEYRDGGGLGPVSLVFSADGPEQYVTSAHLLARENSDLKATLEEADSARQKAQAAKYAADAAVFSRAVAQIEVAKAARAARAAVAAEQSQIAAVSARRDALLAQLAAAQQVSVQLEQQRQQGLAQAAALRAAQAAAAANRNSPPVYDSSQAGRALAYAYAQLGKPYVWGGTGPDSFDCSGLAMRAWGAAGVTLPHYAAFQFQASHAISYSDLSPGDLLFWATDGGDSNTIYHEAIYIGGQQMIQAPRSGENVEISPMWMWGPIQFFARPN